MTFVVDSADLSRPWCPACQPERDPLAEILRVVWCDAHAPSRTGPDDDVLSWPSPLLCGTAETQGVYNRVWCNLIHRSPV